MTSGNKAKLRRFVHPLQSNVVSLEKLVSLLETSESTVRRDLDELEAENKLRRVHGGANCPIPCRKKKPFKKNLSKPSREEVAGSKAASLIKEQDVIFYRCWNNNCFFDS